MLWSEAREASGSETARVIRLIFKPVKSALLALKVSGNGRGCCLGRQCRVGTSGRGDNGNPAADQLAGHCRQAIDLTLRPAVFNCHVLTFDIASVFEALAKCAQQV